MEAPRKIVEAKFGGNRKLLSESGMVGARVRAERQEIAKKAAEEMDALRNEAFDTIALEQREKLAAEKSRADLFTIAEEDIVPLESEERDDV